MERVSAYAEGVRHERAMSESAAHGESTWTRKRTTAEGLMGRFWTFYSKVAQACGVCNLRERIAPLRRVSSALSALILCEQGNLRAFATGSGRAAPHVRTAAAHPCQLRHHRRDIVAEEQAVVGIHQLRHALPRRCKFASAGVTIR